MFLSLCHIAAAQTPFKIDKDKEENYLSICQGLTNGDDDSSYFTNAYSIGKMTIADNGHGDTLLWELYSSVDGSVLDTVVIPKNIKKSKSFQ